jgi:hypothetical protein
MSKRDTSVVPCLRDQGSPTRVPASPIGAALDLVSSFEVDPAGAPETVHSQQANDAS